MKISDPQFWLSLIAAAGAAIGAVGALTSLSAAARLRNGLAKDQELANSLTPSLGTSLLQHSIEARTHRLTAIEEVPSGRLAVLAFLILTPSSTLAFLYLSGENLESANVRILSYTIFLLVAAAHLACLSESKQALKRGQYLAPIKGPASKWVVDSFARTAWSWAYWSVSMACALILAVVLIIRTTPELTSGRMEIAASILLVLFATGSIGYMTYTDYQQAMQFRFREKRLSDAREKLKQATTEHQRLWQLEMTSRKGSPSRTDAYVRRIQQEMRLGVLKRQYVTEVARSGLDRDTGIGAGRYSKTDKDNF